MKNQQIEEGRNYKKTIRNEERQKRKQKIHNKIKLKDREERKAMKQKSK